MDIWEKRINIDNARRDKKIELMKEYDEKIYRPAINNLIEECSNIGHQWRFKHLNPFNYPIYRCDQCGKTEVRFIDQ
jgi:hypothetical protein